MAQLNDLILSKLGSPGDNATDLFHDWLTANSLTGNDSIMAFLVAADPALVNTPINDALVTYFSSLP